MAKLEVVARPGAGVTQYSLFVDGIAVTTDSRHRGSVRCEGRSGDGSSHSLLYAFVGSPGGSLGFTLRCGGRELCRIAPARIDSAGNARKAGRMVFAL
ncbi:MAG TPA: hypothetical protein VIT45_13560 [Allosphingosinicella sp.]